MSAPALSPDDRAILLEIHACVRETVAAMRPAHPDEGRRPEGVTTTVRRW